MNGGDGGPGREPAGLGSWTWPHLAVPYSEHLRAAGLSAGMTRRLVTFARARWNQWGRWDLTPAELEQWLESHPGRKEYRYYLRRLFAFLHEVGELDADPMAAVVPPAIGRPELVAAPQSMLALYEADLLEAGLASGTTKRVLGFARGRWAEWGTWDLTAQQLEGWLNSHSRPRERYYDLRRLYRWLTEVGAVEANPMAALALPGVAHQQPHPADNAASGLSRYELYLVGRGFSPATVRTRTRFARARWAQWGTWDLSPAALAVFVQRQENPWTRSTYFNELRALYRWLEMEGEVRPNPTADMQRPPLPRARPTPLSSDEFARALHGTSGNLRAWLMLGYLAGLRRFEIAKFRGEDINATMIFVVGKGGRAWTIPTHPMLWELAQEYPRTGFWFPSPLRARTDRPITPEAVGNAIGQHFSSLGIAGATHRTRHAYGTELLRSGANIRIVQELMRHESLATTAGYLGVDEEEKADAVQRLGRALSSPGPRPPLRLVGGAS